MIERSKSGRTTHIALDVWPGEDGNIYIALERRATGVAGKGFAMRISPDAAAKDGHPRLYRALKDLIDADVAVE